MSKLSYSEKLKNPLWQRKRLEIMQRDNFMCVLCTDSRSTLHIHHNEYKGNPWDIDNDKLRTLCEHCHSVIHELPKHEIVAIHKRISLNAKCWEVVAFTKTEVVFLYLFFTSHKTEIIKLFPYTKAA